MNIFANAVDVKRALPRAKTITLVGGCFDLIHVGHVHLLEHAASFEDLLVVAVLSDSYARRYKHSLRPIISQEQRSKMVASIRYVDFVYISDKSPSDIETLRVLRPESVVFGVEAGNKEKLAIRLNNISLASPHTKVRFLPRYDKEEISTGYIINKIRNVSSSE